MSFWKRFNPKEWVRDEEGQGLIFGALSFFILAIAILMVIDVGAVAHENIKTQNCADASAYSGGVVQANCLSTIAWLNDGMAYIYYHMMRYTVDVNVYGTYALLETPPNLLPDFRPPQEVVGINNANQLYQEAYIKASEWIPRGQSWLNNIARIERVIALSAPILIKKEIYRVAMEAGADRVSIFPDFVFFPDPASYLRLDIEKVDDGYIITSNTGYWIEVHQTGANTWNIISSLDINMTITKVSDDEYRILNNDTEIVLKRSDLGWSMTAPGLDITMTPKTGWEDGEEYTYYTISSPEGTVNVRRHPETGNLQQDGPPNWVDVPTPDSVTFGDPPQQMGFTNRLDTDRIRVGNATIWMSNPIRINFRNTEIWLSDPIAINCLIGQARVVIRDGVVTVNGVNVTNADGIWHTIDGRWRWRLTNDAPNHWVYEISKASSYLLPESNWDRFGNMHAANDNGPIPDWFNAATGSVRSNDAFYVSRQCWQDMGDHAMCPVCNHRNFGGDQDDDGAQDFTVNVGQVGQFLNNRNPMTRFSLSSFEPPLVLSEDYFKYGLNVAVYRNPQGSPKSGFTNPSWGYFKVASCRVGFLDEGSGQWVFSFADQPTRQNWIQSSFANLYEPAWRASLYPMRIQMKTEDIDTNEEFENTVNYLWNGLINTYWRSTYNGTPDWSVRQKIHRSGINFRSLEIDEVTRH